MELSAELGTGGGDWVEGGCEICGDVDVVVGLVNTVVVDGGWVAVVLGRVATTWKELDVAKATVPFAGNASTRCSPRQPRRYATFPVPSVELDRSTLSFSVMVPSHNKARVKLSGSLSVADQLTAISTPVRTGPGGTEITSACEKECK